MSAEKVNLNDIMTLEYGGNLIEDERNGGDVPVYGSNGRIGLHDEPLVEEPSIMVARKGSIGSVHYEENPSYPIDVTYYIPESSVPENINHKYLYYYLDSVKWERFKTGTSIPSLSRGMIQGLEIPVPPVGEQERIVSLLSDVDEYIEKTSERVHALEQAKQAVLQRVFEEHTKVEENLTLEDYGLNFVKGKTPSDESGSIPYLSTGVYRDSDEPEDYTTEKSSTLVNQNDVAMIMDGSNSGEVFSGKDGAISSTMAKLSFEEDINKKYVKALLEWFYPHINANAMGSTIPHTSKKVVSRLPVFHTEKTNQKEIAEIITNINQEKSRAKEDRDSMRELKRGLLQDIFSG